MQQDSCHIRIQPAPLLTMLCCLLLLSACSVTQPKPEDDMYALSARDALGMLEDIKENETYPYRSPVTCLPAKDNEIEIYINNDGFVSAEYWIKRQDNALYLGIKDDYSRTLFRFEKESFFSILKPSFYTHTVNETDWQNFWLNEIGVQETGENKLVSRAAYDGGDELLEKIGTTKIQIFFDPIYSFLDTYYGVNDSSTIAPLKLAFQDQLSCNNPEKETTIVGK